jgi:hypothetical protein
MTPSADQSAKILTEKLMNRERFIYVRLGDVDVPWMVGRSGIDQTCDGEPYRFGIGGDLMVAWHILCRSPFFLCGDLGTMEDPAAIEVQMDFGSLCAPYPWLHFLHSEALLIHRLTESLRGFYRTMRNHDRPKVLIGPHRVAAAADFLRARFIPIHSTHAHTPGEMRKIRDQYQFLDADIVLLVGGRASKLIAADLAPTDKTVIELGSALDPLFYGRTRSAQIEPLEARAYFSALLWEPIG